MSSSQKKKNIKHEQFCNKFNKDFKNSPQQQKILKKKVMQEPSFDKISETCYFFFSFLGEHREVNSDLFSKGNLKVYNNKEFHY